MSAPTPMIMDENGKGGSILKGKGRGKGPKGQKGMDRPEMWDAVARLTLQSTIQHRCWEAALLQTLLIPSESPVVKAMREAGQQYHTEGAGSGRTEKKRSGTSAHPRIRGFPGGGKRLSLLTPLPDTVQALKKLGRGRKVVERQVSVAKSVEDETARLDKDTTEDHGRGNADGGLPVPHSALTGAAPPLSLREGAEQALEQGHRRVTNVRDDPKDAVSETASTNDRELCVAPERVSVAFRGRFCAYTPVLVRCLLPSNCQCRYHSSAFVLRAYSVGLPRLPTLTICCAS